jgi:hypothetical protein
MRRVGAWAATAGGSLADLGIRLWPRPPAEDGRFEAGEVQVRQGVVLADFAGDAAAIGRQAGTLLRVPLKPLLGLMKPAVLHRRLDGSLPALVAGIPAEMRAELTALAAAAGVDGEDLCATNVVVDAYCSALVHAPEGASGGGRAAGARPLRVARNMDFFPAEAIGPNTVVTVVRPAGRHAFVNIGWPGYAGVVSGMNVHGLVACILLRHGSKAPPACAGAPPMACRVRTVLERCASVEEAVALHREPVASGHYVLLADARTAVVAWHADDGRFRVDGLQGGWLRADNAPRDGRGLATGERADALGRLAATWRPGADREKEEAWMRRALTASFQNGINAQAMLFEPAARRVQVAVGTAAHPAALGAWRALEVGEALDGGGLDTVEIEALPPSTALRHFTRGIF